MTDEQMRYPIGKFVPPVSYTPADFHYWIHEIHTLPGKVRNVTMPLNDHQLNTPYRTGGWTLRQVVHHLADSHMNSLTRFKLALTEEVPTIKPYDEAGWALQADYHLPPEPSLRMLEGIHQRMAALFESFTEDEWERSFLHPASGSITPLKMNLALYVWHGNHHLAHLTETIKKF